MIQLVLSVRSLPEVAQLCVSVLRHTVSCRRSNQRGIVLLRKRVPINSKAAFTVRSVHLAKTLL
jgi:hypothetical protein